MLIYNHIVIILTLRAQHRTLLSIFFTKQYFFLNSNPAKYLSIKKKLSKFAQFSEIIGHVH